MLQVQKHDHAELGGHAGERELDKLMKPWGGFDHNAQSLRILTRLEKRYAQFDGLNLTWETLEGLVKHNGPLVDAEGDPVGRYREHGLPEAIAVAATALLHLWKRNTLVSILAGTAVYMLLVQLVFA